MPVSRQFNPPNHDRVEQALKLVEPIQAEVQAQEAPTLGTAEERVGKQLENGTYIPVNPDADHGPRPIDPDAAINYFEDANNALNDHEQERANKLTASNARRAKLRRGVAGVGIAAAVATGIAYSLATGDNSSPGSNYDATPEKIAHDAAVSQARGEAAQERQKQIDSGVVTLTTPNNPR